MRILIDNGHGKDTAGKRSPDGRVKEWEYARKVAREAVNRLRTLGYDAELLVEEEYDVPLQKRVKRVNTLCVNNEAILVSIHLNAAGDGSRWMDARGWEAWTSVGDTEADRLATCLYSAAGKAGLELRKDNSDGDPDKEGHLYILRKTACPAVLTENMFMDNENDVELLLSKDGFEKITMLHVKGIDAYMKHINK